MDNNNEMDAPIAIIAVISLVGMIGVGSLLAGVFTPVRDWLLEKKVVVTTQEALVSVDQWGIGLDLPRIVLTGAVLLGALALLISAGARRRKGEK